MAKMYSTVQEAAAILGRTEQEVKDMAASGELQQFRDGNNLVFKTADLEALAGGNASGESAIPLADSQADAISLSDTAIPLLSDTAADTGPADASNESTGISVFDAGEIEPADPLAQTTVGGGSGTGLSLESVGSGSGLLDLTRESDDTSLGADLLEDIYPGGDTAAGVSSIDSAVGASGVFDPGLSATGAASGLENLDGSLSGTMTPPAVAAGSPAPTSAAMVDLSGDDSEGSGFMSGLLFGSVIALVAALLVMIPVVNGYSSSLVDFMAKSSGMFWGVTGGLFVVALVCGVIGMVAGKATS
ncbi:helix-turn-helix domain-containing protein [Poriferisphaera sp. WC338]|uniref:helix-turn-helix domain-containing protein n=1 Tax=Poriferisphaera sp. WC338 TaxID=3425129 RepID=UPI003D819391